MRKILMLALASGLFGCSSGGTAPSAPLDPNLNVAKQLVADQFADPEAVKFRKVRDIGGGTYCGEVNAKNQYNAYVGYALFFANAKTQKVGVLQADGSGDYTAFPDECLTPLLKHAKEMVSEELKNDAKDQAEIDDSGPEIGSCSSTKVKDVTTRLSTLGADGSTIPDPDSGTAVDMEDGRYMVSYDVSEEASSWQPGDVVKMCVVDKDKGCSAGSTPTITYSATNQRTQRSWKASSSEHECGGA